MRLPSFLPRVALVVLVALGAGAGLTYAAGQQITSSAPPATTATTPQKPLTLTVPDLRNQAFVFAKGQLQDAGFAWRVTGSVRGYAANTVVSQSPAPGTKLVDTGSPLITVTLARNGSYPQTGQPEDTSSYAGTPLRLADAAVAAAPALPKAAPKPKPAPAAGTAPAAAKKPAARHTTAAPAQRPPAFVVPGARKEPLDEIPLPARAAALGTWLAAHPKKTNANVKHWLFQNAWIVAGARMGWWHGAEALRTLVAVDARTESVWGIGAKSRTLARQALAEVEARSR
ncbi:MAG TPA: PASTA domain-containing protein [Gaiellaceae bacterium]|nr:PASTA domain-containing protein [Gaiellaceae bacterium]